MLINDIGTSAFGAHSHYSLQDGEHNHIALIGGKLVELGFSGVHSHTGADGSHTHTLGSATIEGGAHSHEWFGDRALYGALHTHDLMGGKILTPNDIVFVSLVKMTDGEMEYLTKNVSSPLGVEPLVVHMFGEDSTAPKLISKSQHTIALGHSTKQACNASDISLTATLPHPSALMKNDNGELARKLATLSKRVEAWDRGQDLTPLTARPLLKSVGNLQTIVSVALCPHQFDLQKSWCPPVDVEKSAHDYLVRSRIVDYEHGKVTNSRVVESWLVPYPSPDEREKALANKDHSVYRWKMGDGEVHSGDWVVATKLNKEMWEKFQKGEITGYSIGGYAYVSKADSHPPCKIRYIDLVEGGSGDYQEIS